MDDTGNISDVDFKSTIIGILEKSGDLEVVTSNIKTEFHKLLPDNADNFNNTFINQDELEIKNENLFKRRILGLTSYFRSAQEKLLPSFVTNEDGGKFHVVLSEMSDYQFGIYEKIRKDEADREKISKRNMRKKDALEKISDISYIFTCCL